MIFKKSVSILYSDNVARSLEYYTKVLAFEHKWEWGHPPTFGGVSLNSVEIFFCEKGQGSPGTWISIFIDDVDAYHDLISEKGATIISPPQNMEWGIREMLVEDPDGHRLRVGQHSHVADRVHNSSVLPASIRIVPRVPTPDEYNSLKKSVGWASAAPAAEITEKILAAPLFAVVAVDQDKNETVGCALVLGDGISYYYIKDVMVRSDWQCKRVGTAMMQEVTDWLHKNAPDDAFVTLFTGGALASFYQGFGFTPGFGMHRTIRRG